ncbi:hypothetical protein HDZ31DRAFT_67147 [Schizophyllum fasciatum]
MAETPIDNDLLVPQSYAHTQPKAQQAAHDAQPPMNFGSHGPANLNYNTPTGEASGSNAQTYEDASDAPTDDALALDDMPGQTLDPTALPPSGPAPSASSSLYPYASAMLSFSSAPAYIYPLAPQAVLGAQYDDFMLLDQAFEYETPHPTRGYLPPAHAYGHTIPQVEEFEAELLEIQLEYGPPLHEDEDGFQPRERVAALDHNYAPAAPRQARDLAVEAEEQQLYDYASQEQFLDSVSRDLALDADVAPDQL